MHVLSTLGKSCAATAAPKDSCAVVAHGVAEYPLAALPGLRKQVGPSGGSPLAPAFLRHQDDQTVVGLAAIFAAMAAGSFGADEFDSWGVVAAPRFLGRPLMATALPKFMAEGAWSVSPHTIPYLSLHSIAGAISQALHIHGPNFGVGGGPDGEIEALLAGMAMLSAYSLPGVWVVLTGWEPELVPGAHADDSAPFVCRAIALALSSRGSGAGDLQLSIEPAATGGSRVRSAAPLAPTSRMQVLAAILNDRQYAAAHWPLPGNGMLAWRRGTEGREG